MLYNERVVEMGRTCSIYGVDEKCLQYRGRNASREDTTWVT